MAEEIANLTRHQNITDALLTTMGENMALQQGLLQVSTFDGKNMSLKSFLEDVENGLTFVPDGLRNNYLKAVCSKLKDTARDAVRDKNINNIEDLTNALKEYFSAKKSYPQYCADIQAVRMRQDESVISYCNRIRKIRSNAVASLKENFTEDETTIMTKMLDGLALESFKRGLPDDLVYGVSVQNPSTLEKACKIATRLEEDLKGSSNRKSNCLSILQSNNSDNNDLIKKPPRRVNFEDDERRGSIPFRINRDNNNTNNFIRQNDRDNRDDRSNNFIRRSRSPVPNYYSQGYYPMPFNPYIPPPFQPFIPGMYPQYTPYPNNFYPNSINSNKYNDRYRSRSPSPFSHQNKSESLNSTVAHREDATTSSTNSTVRPATIKFVSAQNLCDGQRPEGKHL